MCILFEICKKTPFQECMGWWSHFSAQHNTLDIWTSADTYPVRYKIFRSMTSFDGVLLVIVVFDVIIHVNVNACGQKFMLRSLGGVCLSIPKLGSNSGGLSSRQNVMLLVGACRWL